MIRTLKLAAAALAFPVLNLSAQARPAEWQATRLFAVGTEPDTTITKFVRSVQLLRDGRLMVVDNGLKTIFVFDSLGRARPALGRVGSGPAEYRNPYALATLGDTIALLDPSNGRIGLFGMDGTWRGSWNAQAITGSSVRLFRVPGKEFYAYGSRRTETRSSTVFIRHDSRGPQDTLAPAPLPQTANYVQCAIGNGGITFFSTTLQTRWLRAPGPGGTILDAETGTYRIEQKTPAGALVRAFTGSAARVAISEAEWDSVSRPLADFLKADRNASCSSRTLDRPSNKPAIRDFWWDDSGRLWVERYAARGFVFDVFNDRGVLIASMPAPERLSEIEPSVVGNRIALVSATTDSVQYVQVFRFGPKR